MRASTRRVGENEFKIVVCDTDYPEIFPFPEPYYRTDSVQLYEFLGRGNPKTVYVHAAQRSKVVVKYSFMKFYFSIDWMQFIRLLDMLNGEHEPKVCWAKEGF